MTGNLSRRALLRCGLTGGAALLALPLLQACGSSAQQAAKPSETAKPGAPVAQPDATSAPAAAATTAPAKTGGAPIVIGLAVPQSGPLSAYGPEMQAGLELALRDANRQVLGRPVEVVIEDTEAKPDVALRKLDKLVSKDNAKYVIGFASSAEALAVADQMPSMKAVFFATVAQTTKLTGVACNRYTFRTALNDAQYIRLIAEDLASNQALKGGKWAILAADYEFGRDASATFKQQTNVQVVSEEYAALGSRDFATFINKLQSAKPDAVFLPMVGQDLINFMKQAIDFGILTQAKFLIPTNIPEFSLKPLGESILGVQCVANYTWTIESPQNQKFVEGFKGLMNGELLPGMYAANTYAAGGMALAAIEKAGDPDPEKVIPVLEQLEYQAPWTTVRFRKEDHQAIAEGHVAEVVKNPASPYGVALKPVFSGAGDKLLPPLAETGCKGV